MTNSRSLCRFVLCLGILCTVLFTTFPAGAKTEYGDIVLSPEPALAENPDHGYIEYLISVTNRSVAQPHIVTLLYPANDPGYPPNRIREMTRSVVVGPASTVLVSLPLPPLPAYLDHLEVAIDGERQETPTPLSGGSRSVWYGMSGTNNPHLLVSKRILNSGFQGHAQSALNPKDQTQPFVFFAPDLPLERWSENWLAYSSYDGIVLAREDLEEMPSQGVSALWRYVECGGSLLVLGQYQVPFPWMPSPASGTDFIKYYVGFGECFVSRLAALKDMTASQWHEVNGSWKKGLKPWTVVTGVADANRLFPVTDKVEIPVRQLFLMVFLFVLAIGPVNLFVLSRRKKRIWLLWSVPLISLLTCVAVIAYAMFGEGFRSTNRTEVVTLLDETTHRATTIGWSAFYSTLTPGGGLHYGYETEVTPQVSWSADSGHLTGTVDWTSEQHLSSGWVSARVPAHFQIRKSETRRERLVVEPQGGGTVTIINGLGSDIRSLWLADHEGRLYNGSDIQAGAKASIEGQRHGLVAKPEKLRELFATDWSGNMAGLTSRPEEFLRPGTYIAWLDGCPFVEEGLPDVKEKKRTAVVYGILESNK